MKQEIQKNVTVTSKGQLTLPVTIRRRLKLNAKRKLRVEMTRDGVITLRALPDIMSFFGALKSDIPFDPKEKDKAREAMGRRAAGKNE